MRVSQTPVGIVWLVVASTYQQADSPVFSVIVFAGPDPFVEDATLLYVQAFSVAWFVSRNQNGPLPETSIPTGGSGGLRVPADAAPRVTEKSVRSATPAQSAETATNCVPLNGTPAKVAPTSISSPPRPQSNDPCRTQFDPLKP